MTGAPFISDQATKRCMPWTPRAPLNGRKEPQMPDVCAFMYILDLMQIDAIEQGRVEEIKMQILYSS